MEFFNLLFFYINSMQNIKNSTQLEFSILKTFL